MTGKKNGMEAIKRYDAMRAAFRAFSPADEIKAPDALLAAKVIGFSENLQINAAIGVVRAFLEKLGALKLDEHEPS
jgi:hypothetical protein